MSSSSTATPVRMKRNIGLLSGTAFVVGSIVGPGVFVTPPDVLEGAGSVGMSLIAWLVGGILSLVGSFIYAELGALVPKTGGEYAYFQEVNFPLVAFLFAWTKAIIMIPSSIAVFGLMFASYVNSFFSYCGPTDNIGKMIAILIILTLCIINIYGTDLSARTQVVFTLISIGAISVVVVGGLVKIAQGNVGALQSGFSGTEDSPDILAIAIYRVMWSYEGWNILHYMAEELINPDVNLFRASVIGVVVATIVYILGNISFLAVLGHDGVVSSTAIASDWSKAVLGPAWPIIPAAVLFSVLGTTNTVFCACGRVLYAAARDSQLPEIVSYVHVKLYTPVPAILMTSAISIAMVIPTGINSLMNIHGFTSWMFYGLATLSLIRMRFTKKDVERPLKVNTVVLILFLLICVFLVIAPVVQNPRIELLWSLAFVAGGILFYVPFVVFKVGHRYSNGVTTFLQLLYNVAPSSELKDK